jgi:SAM-dependent methyltransferase
MVHYSDQERRKRHYLIERALADRLRTATSQERQHLYSSVYDELFEQIPELAEEAERNSELYARQSFKFVRRFLKPTTVFLEIGAGTGALSRLVADHVRQVYALEVSEETIKHFKAPLNVKVILMGSTEIPVPAESVDCAFSTQVLEHIHPDDAKVQVKNIATALKPGGMYVCSTPHRFFGPHDISQYFDDVPTGLHLKEYTIVEMIALFREAGFSRFHIYFGSRGLYFRCPLGLMMFIEQILGRLPRKWQRRVAHLYPLRSFLGINLVVFKM